jgi:HD-GYP domain-containing protein (c-di-GMP phosphodiesterase class II)
MRNVALAAQMHDVGKLGVPDRILTKRDRLTPAEFDVIREHSGRGHEIAMRVAALRPAALGILHHHEKMDGSGYPDGLRGQDIPLEARIVAVADAFDAMTSGRVYQPAVDFKRAFDELTKCAGSHFDPACVKAFHRAAGKMLSIEEKAQAPVAEAA